MQQPGIHTDSEIIEIVPIAQDPNARWIPVVGPETLELLEHLNLTVDSRKRLLEEAVSTLARCRPPTEAAGQETGLVIGYIQSGKTMSFTTLTALARDNGYRLVIVCTGITVNLFEQSRDRLKRDLRVDSRSDRKWYFLSNPRRLAHVKQGMETALQDNDDLSVQEVRTVLVTVMKNGTHLDNLAELLSQLNLTRTPALIIDDEADQASLNNDVNKGAESATYRRMVRLRRLIPHHTFLQYTATPQAILLINLINVLSPSFAEVLTPGSTYTGGGVFFENISLVRRIPGVDIPTSRVLPAGPPESLLEAMRIFFLGVAVGLYRDNGPRNRSMMVHPSSRTMQHANYTQWVTRVRETWIDILSAREDDPDYQDLIADFQAAHKDLSETAVDIPILEELVPHLKAALKDTVITEVNRSHGPTPQPDWHQFYAHIVVGGDVLNRGYTIEGLTVTYMPRGLGTRQADTIQQRARWFGYKADYLGYCRVYLPDNAIRAYRGYVEHESNLRHQMQQHRATGGQLREWRRAFFLDPNLRPTRNSVIDLQYVHGNFSDEWYWPKAPHESEEAIKVNRGLASQLAQSLASCFCPDAGHPKRTAPQRHSVASNVSLKRVYEEFLTGIRVTRPGDSTRFTGLLLQIGRYLERYPDATCTVYRMSDGMSRMRSVNDADEIPTLFQGANYDRSAIPPKETYPGDERIHSTEELTIQIHTLRVERDGALIADEVPAIAVWVPKRMAASWVSQPQGQH